MEEKINQTNSRRPINPEQSLTLARSQLKTLVLPPVNPLVLSFARCSTLTLCPLII